MLGVAGFCAVLVASAATVPAASEGALSVVLNYQETPSPIATCNLYLAPSDVTNSRIRKLPESGRSRLLTGILELGQDRVALAWNKLEGKLYLDLNRNFDLTDDPNGVFSSGRSALFKNIRLSWTNDYGECRQLLDLQLIDRGRIYAYATLRSFYSGKLELAGKAWQVGVIENPLSRASPRAERSLLLRSWDNRADAIDTEPEAAESFPLNRTVFIEDRLYAAKLSVQPTNGKGRLILDFTPQPGQTAELQFAGEHVSRLVLEASGGFPATFLHPAGTLTLPTGTYTRARVWLKSDTREAYGAFPVRVAVGESSGAAFSAGGPLTNSVAVSRRGRILRLDYRLVGINGQTYRLLHQDRSKPPEFAIYKGDKRLVTGQFAFG